MGANPVPPAINRMGLLGLSLANVQLPKGNSSVNVIPCVNREDLRTCKWYVPEFKGALAIE